MKKTTALFLLPVAWLLLSASWTLGWQLPSEINPSYETVEITTSGDKAPLKVTPLSSPPTDSIAAGSLYLDDGTNTASHEPGWRVYRGSAWEDVGALAGGSATGGDIWENPTAITGATTLTVGHSYVCSGTTADYTLTLPTAVGNSGELIAVKMANGLTKLVTLDGTGTETIDGEETRVMWAGESAVMQSDGSEWTKVEGVTKPMYAVIGNNANQSIPTSTLTLVTLGAAGATNNSLMQDVANNRIVILRTGRYRITGSVRYSAFSATHIAEAIVSTDSGSGAQYLISKYILSGDWPVIQLTCPVLECLAGTYYYLKTRHYSGGTETVYGDANTTWLLVSEMNPW